MLRRASSAIVLAALVAAILSLMIFESVAILTTQKCQIEPRERAAAAENQNAVEPPAGEVEVCDPLVIVSALLDPDRITAFGTIVIAVFTIVLGVGTCLLVGDGREHSRRSLRAYVSITSSALADPEQPGSLTFLVRIKNTGATPANELSDWTGTGVHEFPLVSELKPPPTRDIHKMSLGPGCESLLKVTKRMPLTATEENEIKKAKALYVFGRVEYLDIFGHPQFTHFRFVYRGGGPSEIGLKRYRDGNDAS